MNLEEYLNQSLRKTTVKSYLFTIEKFRRYSKDVDKYDYQKLIQYIETLREHYHPKTIGIAVGCIKKYYDYLIEIGKRNDNPARAIRLLDGKEKSVQLQDLLTPNELQSLLEPRVERYPFLAKKNQIIMSLLVHQALRVGELAQLKLDDINLEKATIKITGLGHTNSRILDLKAEQIILFYQYINQDRIQLKTHRDDKSALLIGKIGTPVSTEDIEYLISTYQKQYKKRITTTTIRQSVITNLLAKNNDLRVVQHFAGHKSLDTTEKYKETGLNALKTAIDKLHPIR